MVGFSFMCTTLLYDLLPININFIYFGFILIGLYKSLLALLFLRNLLEKEASLKRQENPKVEGSWKDCILDNLYRDISNKKGR